MLDFDLAQLYEVEARMLNQAVKRNSKIFPDDFMFQLTKVEFDNLKVPVDSSKQGMSSQIVMTYPSKRPNSALPYAFTEQGMAMLSGVLNSNKAINMNIAIMRSFVEMRRIALSGADLITQLQELKARMGEHDMQLSSIYDAIENLLDEKAAQRKWEERERIGFKN